MAIVQTNDFKHKKEIYPEIADDKTKVGKNVDRR